MGRPPKSANTIKRHATKSELEHRKKAEKALTPDGFLTEWKRTGTPRGHNWYFKRVKKLFADVGEDSDMYSAVINRYCELLEECGRLEQEARKTLERIIELEKRKDELEYKDWLDLHVELMKCSKSTHDLLDRKRNMLLAIEKENLMTVMAKLRAVPKKPKDEADDDPMTELLAGRPQMHVLC